MSTKRVPAGAFGTRKRLLRHVKKEQKLNVEQKF
jgi:hypothetical protein